jgi:hypothetical protein
MNYDLLLSLLTPPVMLSWLAMAVAPRWRVTRAFLHSDVVPLVIGVVYLSIALRYVPGWFSSFRNLDTIGELFTHRDLLFVGWIHYLAFDLFVGRSILADSQRRGIPHLLVVPCLFMTLMFGPGGYVAYALVRLGCRKYAGAVTPLPAPDAPAAAPAVQP